MHVAIVLEMKDHNSLSKKKKKKKKKKNFY